MITFFSNPVFLVIIGAFIGFVPAVGKDYINLHWKSRKTKNDLALNHLNEIFVLLSKSSSNVRKTIIDIMDKEKTRNNDFNDTSARLSFLIRVYFLNIFEQYQDYIKKSTAFGFYQIQVSQKTVQLEKNEFTQLSMDFENSLIKISDIIIKEASKYK